MSRTDHGNTIELNYGPSIEQDMKKKGLVHLALTIIVVAILYFWIAA
ncbi:MAG: hypothetical protein VYB82_06965 [Pseudomonadota bacterium]|nr:hypothetical protein [Pseudomonadota bacterium]